MTDCRMREVGPRKGELRLLACTRDGWRCHALCRGYGKKGFVAWLLVSFGGNGGGGKGDLNCFSCSELRSHLEWPSGSGLDSQRESTEGKLGCGQGKEASAKEESLVEIKIEQPEVRENQSTAASEPETVFMEQEEGYNAAERSSRLSLGGWGAEVLNDLG